MHLVLVYLFKQNSEICLKVKNVSNYNQITVSHWDANHNQRIEYNFLGILHRWFIALQIAKSGYNLCIV